MVENDGAPESMILLTGLKNIFQRQLPKMPREYITRLVMDRNHQSLAIVKRGLQVVGGITYRPFNHRKFAEIVFCAISSTEQVKVGVRKEGLVKRIEERAVDSSIVTDPFPAPFHVLHLVRSHLEGLWVSSNESSQGSRQSFFSSHAFLDLC